MNFTLFLELVLIDTPGGKYGDYMVKQSQSIEDRKARKETPILGNGKIVRTAPQPTTHKSNEPENDDPPF